MIAESGAESRSGISAEHLVAAAKTAAEIAYAPYSHFRVGAALLCEDGTIVTGVNVENRSYGLTVCAERSAVMSAVSTGKSSFRAIAVCAIDSDRPVPPCGACRQVMSEFVEPDFRVLYAGRGSGYASATIGDLLPVDSLHNLRTTET